MSIAPMSYEDGRRYLLWNVRRRAGWLHGRGCRWFSGVFMPLVRDFEKMARGPEDHVLLGWIYYEIADLYFFNDSPAAAARALRRSILHDPSHGEAYRELGGRLSELGCGGLAEKHLREAVTKSPEDAHAKSDLEDLLAGGPRSMPPAGSEERVFLLVREFLASNDFMRAQKLLRSSRSVEARLYRACALGAQGLADDFYREWEDVVQSGSPVTLLSIHWFHTPPEMRDDARFWENILFCVGRFEHGNYCYTRSLWDEVHKGKEGGDGLPELQTVIRLQALFELARIGKDPSPLRPLLKEYPGWKEAADLAKRLGG